MNRTKITSLGVGLTLGLLVPACHQPRSPEPQATLPAVAVTVSAVEATDRRLGDLLPGTVVARTNVYVQSRIPGRVTAIHVEPGQAVRRDGVLVELDASGIEAGLDRTRAALRLAQQNEARIRQLFERQAATRAELDAATSQLQQAQASVAEVESELDHSVIKAPLDAIVADKMAEVGDIAAPGRTLLELESGLPHQFEAGVSESVITRVELGGEHDVLFNDGTLVVQGRVREISPAGSPATRTWRVKWDLPADLKLRTGAYGRVMVPSQTSKGISIPGSLVIRRGQLEQVYVAVDGHAVLRLIRTGARMGETVEVLSGLVEGDLLIVSDAGQLSDGREVSY